MFHKLKSNQSPCSNPNKPFTNADGTKTESDTEKANVFANHLADIFQFLSNPVFDSLDRKWKQK